VGSADLMPRNLDRRVEILFPVSLPRHVRYLRDDVLATYLADNVKARELQADGTYVRVRSAPGALSVSAQAALLGLRGAHGAASAV
jgi:polyphosphate kinase